jgi:hypothetical protein
MFDIWFYILYVRNLLISIIKPNIMYCSFYIIKDEHVKNVTIRVYIIYLLMNMRIYCLAKLLDIDINSVKITFIYNIKYSVALNGDIVDNLIDVVNEYSLLKIDISINVPKIISLNLQTREYCKSICEYVVPITYNKTYNIMCNIIDFEKFHSYYGMLIGRYIHNSKLKKMEWNIHEISNQSLSDLLMN